MSEIGEVATSLTLPSGLVLPNRLVKAAMAESLAKNGRAGPELVKVYEKWGQGEWGAIMTGNVMVDERYMGSPQDTTVQSKNSVEIDTWQRIARGIKAKGALALMQINHPGRQSPAGAGSRGFLQKNLAPSAVSLNFGTGVVVKTLVKVLFGTPAEMSTIQIQTLINQFADAAKFAQQVGFDGVTIHAAHGYLLSDFLSPKTNTRTDAYGGTPEKRARIIVEIIEAIREVVSTNFSISVKMNSSDQQYDAGSDAVLKQVDVLVAQGVDFLEISGGSYENPRIQMMRGDEVPAKSERTQKREAFFLDFALAVRERHPDLHLMLTGGFRTRSGMNSALQTKGCDMIGIGRPAATVPDFPRSVIGIGAKRDISDAEAGLQMQKVETPWLLKHLPFPELQRVLVGGAETMHYGQKIGEMAKA
ncbi:NADPH dehydrogenase [Aureobasidium pullulans]|uniref:NADPH dehydrogenase n=1 Tax=Aureobasidium pullulans TaxID=5580 RepID=A0A4V4IHB9_AURPU|nr:NADPH dehydrogenase [Aureobasidium pullulans]THX66433.1 NADPH dehydrogenase [Aureobasidium pullulans]THX78471.1 NADPH dehydrogenase [Aureobasidium pullulans]